MQIIFFPINRFDGKPFFFFFLFSKFGCQLDFVNSLTRETVLMMPLPSAQGNMQQEKKLSNGFYIEKDDVSSVCLSLHKNKSYYIVSRRGHHISDLQSTSLYVRKWEPQRDFPLSAVAAGIVSNFSTTQHNQSISIRDDRFLGNYSSKQ